MKLNGSGCNRMDWAGMEVKDRYVARSECIECTGTGMYRLGCRRMGAKEGDVARLDRMVGM